MLIYTKNNSYTKILFYIYIFDKKINCFKMSLYVVWKYGEISQVFRTCKNAITECNRLNTIEKFEKTRKKDIIINEYNDGAILSLDTEYENKDEYYCTKLTYKNKMKNLTFISILEEEDEIYSYPTLFIFAAKNREKAINEALEFFYYDHNIDNECKKCKLNGSNRKCKKKIINKFNTENIVNFKGGSRYYHCEIWIADIND